MGRDPADLYEAEPGAPTPDRDLVMLYYLDGFIDAGAAGRLLSAHLLSSLEHEQIARFDIDSVRAVASRISPSGTVCGIMWLWWRVVRIERRAWTAFIDGSSPHRRHMNKMLITISGFLRMIQG